MRFLFLYRRFLFHFTDELTVFDDSLQMIQSTEIKLFEQFCDDHIESQFEIQTLSYSSSEWS